MAVQSLQAVHLETVFHRRGGAEEIDRSVVAFSIRQRITKA